MNLELYTYNIFSLASAITRSGGDPYIVMNKKEIVDFLQTLARNNITLKAEYVKGLT